MFGIVPNVIVSLINIWANSRLTTHHFDRQFFWGQQLPVVNTINYSLGTISMLGILWPLLRVLWNEDVASLHKEQKASLGYRCLAAPGWIAAVIVMLWIFSGVVFPMWNRVAPESSVGLTDSLVFLSSQILHGIIAAATTFVFISLVLVTALFPLMIGEREDPQGVVRLARFRNLLNRSVTCLGLSPLLAILLLALTDWGDDQAEQSVFVMLALVGFAGHWIASRIIPFISAKVEALMLALASTTELPGMTVVDAFRGTVSDRSR